MNRSTALPLVIPALLVSPILLAAAGQAPLSDFLAATEQVERGKNLFAANCAKCRGDQGQGGEGLRIIGSPNGLHGYRTARGLFDFVSSDMPFDNPGSLKAEEYWDILAFILDANRLLPPDTDLGPDNAASIRISE